MTNIAFQKGQKVIIVSTRFSGQTLTAATVIRTTKARVFVREDSAGPMTETDQRTMEFYAHGEEYGQRNGRIGRGPRRMYAEDAPELATIRAATEARDARDALERRGTAAFQALTDAFGMMSGRWGSENRTEDEIELVSALGSAFKAHAEERRAILADGTKPWDERDAAAKAIETVRSRFLRIAGLAAV